MLECSALSEDEGDEARLAQWDVDLRALQESDLVAVAELTAPARYVWRVTPLPTLLFAAHSKEGTPRLSLVGSRADRCLGRERWLLAMRAMIRDLRRTRRSVAPDARTPRDLPPLPGYVALDVAMRRVVDRFVTQTDAHGRPLLRFTERGYVARLLQGLEQRAVTPSSLDPLLFDAELTLLPLFSQFLDA